MLDDHRLEIRIRRPELVQERQARLVESRSGTRRLRVSAWDSHVQEIAVLPAAPVSSFLELGGKLDCGSNFRLSALTIACDMRLAMPRQGT
ncbi:MAG: hypothetical protein OXF73_00050 [Gammaproteobacteria bacterium]|nr:hypothetical protein [Gammaproteobacteria bacterium]MCY4228063.1 hypothetical protein [Gammaproteobacteria bacterium]